MTKRAPTLITGANGRLGRVVQRMGVGADPTFALGSPRAAGSNGTLDITDASAVYAAFEHARPRVVVHLAAVVGATCTADPSFAHTVNVDGTANLISAAQAFDVERFVFLSTAAVYGDSRRHPVSENDVVQPSGPYAESKLQAESVLSMSAGTMAIDVLRVFNVFGPEMGDSLISRLLSATSTPVSINGLDSFVRDYIHVNDVARAVGAAANSEGLGYRVLNIGSGIPRSNRDLLDSLPAASLSPVTIGPEVESYSCADITAAKESLGWRPIEPWPPQLAH